MTDPRSLFSTDHVLASCAFIAAVALPHTLSGQNPNDDLPVLTGQSGFYDVTQGFSVGDPLNPDFEYFPATSDDGVDDSPNLQSLINWAAQQSKGATIFFPNGVYHLDSTLTIPNNNRAASSTPNAPLYGITLLGASRGASLVVRNGVNGIVVEGAPGATVLPVSTHVRNFSIQRLRIVDHHVNSRDWGGRAGIGLLLRSTQDSDFEDLKVIGFAEGIRLELASYKNHFDNVEASLQSTYGIRITSANQPPGLGAEAWHVDNFWSNIRATGLNSEDPADISLKPIAGILIDGTYVGDQHFEQVLVGMCNIGMRISWNGVDGQYHNDVKLSGFIADWNQEASLRVDRVSNVRVSDGFFGVRGVVLADADDILISNSWFNGAPRELATSPKDIWALTVHNAKRLGVNNCRFTGFQRAVDLVNVQASTFSDLKVKLKPSISSGSVYGVRLADDAAVPEPQDQGCRYVSFATCIFQSGITGQAVTGILERGIDGKTVNNQFVYNMFQPLGTAVFTDTIVLRPGSSSIKFP